jgi:hypothetical protein
MRFTNPVKTKHMIAAMWLAAIGLMVWDTVVADHMTKAGRWSILLAVGASGWTVCDLARHSRRVILEVMKWERFAYERATAEAEETVDNVRAIR